MVVDRGRALRRHGAVPRRERANDESANVAEEGMKLVGLDIGTTTICGILLDPDSTEVAEVRTEPNSATLPHREPWDALQDPEVILATARRILQGFLDSHADVRGIGVTGQMHGILYLDRSGSAVSPLYTWQDGRGDQMRPDGKSHAAFLSQAVGMPLATGMGSVTHYCLSVDGKVPRAASTICTIADYIALRLAHASAPVIDATNAASLGCFDLARLSFRPDAVRTAGLDPSMLPRVATSYPALGEARDGAPVFVALGDNQASFLGSVHEIEGAVLVNIGTGSQISVYASEAPAVTGIDARPFPFGGYLCVGAALCGGRAFAALRGFFEKTVALFSGAAPVVDWEIMNRIDSAELSGAPLAVDTRWSGTRADPEARGSITNLGLDNFTPAHLVAGVREGIADELLEFYKALPESLRATTKRLYGSGNGIRLNPALCRVFEEKLGMRMSIPPHREEASYGAALLAGLAGGAAGGMSPHYAVRARISAARSKIS
jgi:sedoheptulokinase